eukprot:Nitzschia sp. Nitz4//scaffold226_size53432//8121//9948//NITZ4_006692-RA/size53432-augustus-gene-0.54-mRNA-1//1//CDS//3329542724//5189//frame0
MEDSKPKDIGSASTKHNNNTNHTTRKRKRLDKTNDQIVIVGGGLAGVSCAIALERAGYSQVVLYERDQTLQEQKEGYGLTLTYNPKGPLAMLGPEVLEEVAQQDCPSRSHYLFRQDGVILGYYGNAFSSHGGSGQRGNLRVPRKVLRELLFRKLVSTRVRWGHRLVDYEWDDNACQYQLRFETKAPSSTMTKIVTTQADLLVAADGIRSRVLEKLYANAQTAKKPIPFPGSMGLRPMHVRLILGISNFTHPLLYERGFYTLDGKHRLFTMPYSSDRFDKTQSNRVMWQLSFALDDDDMALGDIHTFSAESLRKYVLNTCGNWHSPVMSLIEATPIETIWGTDLQDRDPTLLKSIVEKLQTRRVVAVGDALHPMSPFKGQGANQALADGPLLVSCLQRASIDSAVTTFWREAVQRSATVVKSSRQAAMELHSDTVLKSHHGFSGVPPDKESMFLDTLDNRDIGANKDNLDSTIDSVIQELGVRVQKVQPEVDNGEQVKALQAASTGETRLLRVMSLAKHSESIRTAKDADNRTCLHLAVIGGHVETCKWLHTELDCDLEARDRFQKTARDYSTQDTIRNLFNLD